MKTSFENACPFHETFVVRSFVCLPLKSLGTNHVLNINPLSKAELAKFFFRLTLYAICSLCWLFVCCEEIFNFCVCLLLVPWAFNLQRGKEVLGKRVPIAHQLERRLCGCDGKVQGTKTNQPHKTNKQTKQNNQPPTHTSKKESNKTKTLQLFSGKAYG